MAYDPSIFNINPYYDDFDAAKGFLRVLFKPGYAVQARELTQAQTLLQNQLSKIGDHLFKDGSRIIGGGISVRNASYIMVDAGVSSPLLGATNYEDLIGSVLTSSIDGDLTEARVVHYVAPDVSSDGLLVLIVDFVSGFAFESSFNLTKGSFQYNGFVPAPSAFLDGVEYPSTGACKLVSVNEGVFYIDGFFVRSSTQFFSPYEKNAVRRDFRFDGFSQLNKKIGFLITRDGVTERDDNTLRDPAIGSYNYNAPGADRYKITPVLSQVELLDTPDDFVELVRFEGGKVVKKADRISYGEIEKTLARRTFDESGSYSVNPFDISIKRTADSTEYFNLVMGQGKAYILGQEVENAYPKVLPFPRAQTVQEEGTSSPLSYDFSTGNYLDVTFNSDSQTLFASNLPSIASGSVLARFFGTTNNTVATGYVHGAIPTNANGVSAKTYRLYLYGISGAVQSGRSACIYLHTNGNTLGRFAPSSGTTFPSPSQTVQQSLVYEVTPGYAVSDFSSLRVVGKLVGGNTNLVAASHNSPNTTYSVTKDHFSDSLVSPSSSVFSFFNYGSGANTSSSDTQEIAIIDQNGNAFVPPASGTVLSSVDTSQFSLVITNAANGFTSGSFRIAAPVIYTPVISDVNTYRYKTTATSTHQFVTNSFNTDSVGRKYFRLPHIDVFSISSIVNQADQQIFADDFELDDGQRESHYENARLYIKENASSKSVYNGTAGTAITLVVSYSRFIHNGLQCAPFIGKHSYTDLEYEKIPLYTNPRTGKTVSLANCIDFRRSGLTSSVAMLKPYGRSEFGTIGDTEIKYSHYLPRIDKICLKADVEDGSPLFFLESGTPDISPVSPSDPADSLVLATLTVPAYTHNPEDIMISPVNSKRYTMSDIGRMEKRVDDVEVFTKLSLSETELETRSLKTSVSQTEPLKTSIFVDELYGHSSSDVVSNFHSCSIDLERSELRPFFVPFDVGFVEGVTSDTRESADGIVTLNYTSKLYIDNKKYTKTIKPNPSNNVNWLGFLKITPQVTTIYDKSVRPVVKTNSLMENDNWLSSNANDDRGFGTQWNDWESIWFGIDDIEEEQQDIQNRILQTPRINSESSVSNINSGNVKVSASRNAQSVDQRTSSFMRTRYLKNRIKTKIGNKIIDRSVIPYIPYQTVSGLATGLKPNSQSLSVFFDSDLVLSGVTSDENGTSRFSFDIINSSALVGSRTVRISDADAIENSTLSADAVYHCSGILNQRDSGSFSTRPPELRRQSVNSETIAKDPFNRDLDTIENNQWSDPLSQTFFVDKKTNAEGIFLNSVSLFFSSKDSKLPVAVQIRPTLSGYPSPSVVLPFSTVVKMPSEVNASSVPAETKFEFSSPVYLEPGEYSICVLTNSDDYELFAAESSFNSIPNSSSTSGRAGNNQLVGTLFVAQGLGAAVPDNTTDLMFSLERCEFASQGTYSINSATNLSDVQVVKFYSSEIIPSGCSISRQIGTTEFYNGESIYPETAITPNIVYTLRRGASNAVSPVFDRQTLVGTSVQMYTNRTSTSPYSEYVSRVVELPDYITSNGIAVFVDENTPTQTQISVQYRCSVSGETDIFDKPWANLSRSLNTPQFTSSSDLDFREAEFRGVTSSFQSYQIKVRLSSAASPTYSRTPSVRNIRTISFIQPT